MFVTTGLNAGGAEKQLARLLRQLHGKTIRAEVVSLLKPGPVAAEIETLGVPVHSLALESPWHLAAALLKFHEIVRRVRPAVIQGWMYHGNLAALLLRRLSLGRPVLYWGVRQSLNEVAREKVMTRQVIRAGALLSGRVDAIIYNSETARRQHEAFGYSGERTLVIDNGFDLAHFKPDEKSRTEVRSELGISVDGPLIGLIARFHPIKGHEVFLEAAKRLASKYHNVDFVLVGCDVSTANPFFVPWLDEPLLKGRLHLLGERSDIPRLTAALDIASLSSWGEAFPNALGEAMSCGVPCVATDCGDVRRILGETGAIVPIGDSAALADRWAELLKISREERMQLGQRARDRVRENYSLTCMATAYATLYGGSET